MSFSDYYEPTTKISLEQIVLLIKLLDEEQATLKSLFKKDKKHWKEHEGYCRALKKASDRLKGMINVADRAYFNIIYPEAGDYDYRW